MPPAEPASDEEVVELTALDNFQIWLNRQQWFGWVLLASGVAVGLGWSWRPWGLGLAGGAVLYAGLVPVITGFYRGFFGPVYGWKARARGLVSVAIGVALLALATLG